MTRGNTCTPPTYQRFNATAIPALPEVDDMAVEALGPVRALYKVRPGASESTSFRSQRRLVAPLVVLLPLLTTSFLQCMIGEPANLRSRARECIQRATTQAVVCARGYRSMTKWPTMSSVTAESEKLSTLHAWKREQVRGTDDGDGERRLC